MKSPRPNTPPHAETQPLARRESGAASTSGEAAIAAASVPAVAVPPVRVSRAALSSGRRWRTTARWAGLAMFGVGAALLGYVFWQALNGFQAFSKPDYLSGRFNRIAGDSWESIIQAVVGVVATEILSVLYLLLLGFLASAIASKGIQFFAASEAVIDEAVEGVE